MARSKAANGHPVSAGNPCPFLRGLVAEGLLADDVEPLVKLSQTIAAVARTGDGEPTLPAAALGLVALIANGLWPWQALGTAVHGLHLDQLRDGPLDKHGAGSGILDAKARVVKAELARLDSFAADKPRPEGGSERGLDLADLKRFMDANFERAAGHRRAIDRRLMDGEWPVLLKVMGKGRGAARYLSVAEVKALFTERRLPRRMLERLAP